MKPDGVQPAQPVPANDFVRPQEHQGLSELFALLGNDRLEQALTDLEPNARPSTKA